MPRPPLFNFILHPIEEIEGWGEPDGPKSLHWWGLTDSWYWMNAGGVELMRYSDAVIAANPQWDQRRPYFNYQAARLHEDVLAILPHVLEPVPDDILERVADPDSLRSFTNLLEQWSEVHWPRDKSKPDYKRSVERAYDIYGAANEWRRERTLSGGHLSGQPSIHFVADNQEIAIVWLADESVQRSTGIRWSDTPDGTVSMSRDEFIAEVRDFDTRLMGEMTERVRIARKRWPRPEIGIDLPELVRAHYEQQQMLDAAIEKAAHIRTDWIAVRRAIETIEQQSIG